MKKSITLMTGAALFLASIMITPAVWAVDTTETFSVGAFTDYEAYASLGYGKDGTSYGLEFLVGGGITERFSYYVTTGASALDKDISIDFIGLGFIITPVEIEKFAFDIIPGIAFDANRGGESFAYPGFDAFTAGITLEFNCMALAGFQPYLLAGFEGSYDYLADDDFTYAFPISVGALFPVKDKVEFLMQFSWSPNDSSAWMEAEREVAAGVNVMATEELEVISQVGFEFYAKNFNTTLGLIYAW
ncbi:MAG TPA: hypothetical protein PK926_00675 [Spirochaetota bacterium]|nr:hypothetical protein [Spirochaetota bacterium]HPI87864.1 hypothetical protein [Spirochaetota bacterium]HPR47404.1 hypothetical protein [Spirochaetota bacterium]